MSCVGLGGSLFAARDLDPGDRAGRGLRILPHLINTLLLASGSTLAFLIHQYPFFNSDWMTAKVIGLIVYIGLGVAVSSTVRHATINCMLTCVKASSICVL